MNFETLSVRKERAVLFADIAAPPMNLLGPRMLASWKVRPSAPSDSALGRTAFGLGSYTAWRPCPASKEVST